MISRTLDVQEDPLTGDLFIEIPDDILKAANLTEGDTIDWVKNGDNSWILRKANDTSIVETTK